MSCAAVVRAEQADFAQQMMKMGFLAKAPQQAGKTWKHPAVSLRKHHRTFCPCLFKAFQFRKCTLSMGKRTSPKWKTKWQSIKKVGAKIEVSASNPDRTAIFPMRKITVLPTVVPPAAEVPNDGTAVMGPAPKGRPSMEAPRITCSRCAARGCQKHRVSEATT